MTEFFVENYYKAIDMVYNDDKVGEMYNVGGHNDHSDIFIMKTIIKQLHDRLNDEGISENLIKYVEDKLDQDRIYILLRTRL